MIYFLLCQPAGYGQMIAIEESDDLPLLLDATAYSVGQSPEPILVLGTAPHVVGGRPEGLVALDLIEEQFEYLEDHEHWAVHGYLRVPNSHLLEYIMDETSPHDRAGREALIRLCEGRKIEDDLVRFGDHDEGEQVTWKRFGDLTIEEATDFVARIRGKSLDLEVRTENLRSMMEDRFGKDAVQEAQDRLDGPLPDLDA